MLYMCSSVQVERQGDVTPWIGRAWNEKAGDSRESPWSRLSGIILEVSMFFFSWFGLESLLIHQPGRAQLQDSFPYQAGYTAC